MKTSFGGDILLESQNASDFRMRKRETETIVFFAYCFFSVIYSSLLGGWEVLFYGAKTHAKIALCYSDLVS